jgi:hypothetical protein
VTALKQAQRDARTVLEGGSTGDPLAAADRLLYFVEGAIAARLQRRFQNEIADLPLNEFVVMRDGLLQVAKQRERLASFMHAKLRPTEHSVPPIKNTVKVVLRIDGERERERQELLVAGETAAIPPQEELASYPQLNGNGDSRAVSSTPSGRSGEPS